jgi:hypothetical protein
VATQHPPRVSPRTILVPATVPDTWSLPDTNPAVPLKGLVQVQWVRPQPVVPTVDDTPAALDSRVNVVGVLVGTAAARTVPLPVAPKVRMSKNVGVLTMGDALRA